MILDLFAGPGGWDEGLRSIGITDVIGMEWDAAACATRAAAGHRTIRADVSQYPPAPFVGKVRGLIASPPCQAWSMAGKGHGRAEVDRVHEAVEACRDGWRDDVRGSEWLDVRTPLILEPLRWAWALRPTWIALEQVPPALGVWEHMADVLRSWGYRADARVLCAADYGVPQTRYRAILIAHRERLAWPEPTHAENPGPSLFGALKPWVTMAEALGWGGELDRRQNGAPTLNPNKAPSPTVVGTALAKGVWVLRQNNRPNAAVRTPDEPAPTLHFSGRLNAVDWVYSRPPTTVQADPRIGRPGHKDREGGEAQFGVDYVRITVGEASILQGFPADYPWQGSKTKQFEQVGNAVPPPLAAAICGALEGVRAGREAADAA